MLFSSPKISKPLLGRASIRSISTGRSRSDVADSSPLRGQIPHPNGRLGLAMYNRGIPVRVGIYLRTTPHIAPCRQGLEYCLL